MTKLFISYAHNDTYVASGIIALLRVRYGYNNVWSNVWSHEELSNRGGSDWWDKILKAIKGADVFVYLLSDDSVKSPYCQAEFQEAQRLQKPFVLAQVRDNTKLPQDIATRQYIDMKSGVGDATLADTLINSIDHQRKEAKGNSKPLWVPATPRPNQDAIATVRRNLIAQVISIQRDPIAQIISILVAPVVVVIILTLIVRQPDSAHQATPSTTATTAPTATAPLTPPTDLPIALVVGTLDARGTLEQAVANEQAPFSARVTEFAVSTQSSVDQTATATQWTSTPTPDVTASIEAFRTQRATTETQAWTSTPTPNVTASIEAFHTQTAVAEKLLSAQVANLTFAIYSISGSEIGNGRLRVFYSDQVNFAETTRIELELVFDNYYITPTPFGIRTIVPAISGTSIPTSSSNQARKPTSTPRIPKYEGSSGSIEIYQLMGASLVCLPESFSGCEENKNVESARLVTFRGIEWTWIISPKDGIQGTQDLRLELWRLISINGGSEQVEIVWNHPFQIKVQKEGANIFVQMLTQNLGAFIGAISAIIVALIGGGYLISKDREKSNKATTK